MTRARMADLRAFRIVEVVAALGGAKNLDPGRVFPSLKDYSPPSDDVDDEESLQANYLQIKNALERSSTGL